MKKRIFTFVLTLCLCLGFVIPVSAAEVSDLTSGEAASYFHVLSSQSYSYSALEDLNVDGKPELILADIEESTDSMFETLTLTVWTIRNGTAVKTMSQSISANSGSALNDVGIARQSGATRIYVSDSNPPMNHATYRFYDMNGNATTYQGEMDLAGTAAIDSLYEELAQSWEMETLFHGEGGSWYWEEDEIPDVKDDLQNRMEQASGTSSEPNTYTVTGYEDGGSFYTIIFEVTSVEKKTLLVMDDGAFADGWEPTRATLVSVRPGSTIKATGGTTIAPDFSNSDEPGVAAMIGWMDGLNCSMTGQIGANILNGPASKTFRDGNEVYRLWTTDRDGDPIFVCLGKETAAAGGFTDVKADAYYADAVAWAVDREITTGTSATTFSPNNTCTTAQILTFLWRANGSPAVSGSNPFSDVSAGAYYYQAALWAREKGLVSGSAFRGDTPCTRAATVTYLWKLAGQPSAGASSFTDVPASAGYAQAVAWAVNEGITSGTGDQKFSPDAICTRGQIMTFIYRDMVG